MAGLFLASVAIRFCFVDTNTGSCAPLVFPTNGSITMMSPFLVRILPSGVPRCHQYYGTLRLPVPTARSLMYSLPGSCVSLPVCFIRLEASPDDRVLFSHRTNGDCTQVSTGSRRFLRNPSCTSALVSDPGRAGIASPYRQASADPIFRTMKPPTVAPYRDSIPRLQYLLSTLHNQRYHWLCKTRFRLMVNLCRAGVEPAGFQ